MMNNRKGLMDRKCMGRCPTTAGGFTLIELSVVMLILGILLSLGIGKIGPAVVRSKTVEAQRVVDAAVDAVVGYVAQNNKLPAQADFTAAVPQATDPFGRPLTYVIGSSALLTAGTLCDQNESSTSLKVKVCDNDACTASTTIPNIAFMAWSDGADAKKQLRTDSTLTLTAGGGATTVDNIVSLNGVMTTLTISATLPNIIIPKPGDTVEVNKGAPFDDIVRWMTLGELKQKIGCGQGGLGSPLRIVNTSLPSGKVGSTYNSAIQADGGIIQTTYRWCYEVTGTLTGVSVYLKSDFTVPLAPVASCPAVIEENWGSSDAGNPSRIYLSTNVGAIPGTITAAAGTYVYNFYLRDSANPAVTAGVNTGDNIVLKKFVVTVDP